MNVCGHNPGLVRHANGAPDRAFFVGKGYYGKGNSITMKESRKMRNEHV